MCFDRRSATERCSLSEPLEDAKAWLAYAREDLSLARREHERDGSVHRWVCFAAKQAAEKAIKAILVFEQIEFPFIHNIERLKRLVPTRWRISNADIRLAALTPWAVAGRYPADVPEATEKDADIAVGIATEVVSMVEHDITRLQPSGHEGHSDGQDA